MGLFAAADGDGFGGFGGSDEWGGDSSGCSTAFFGDAVDERATGGELPLGVERGEAGEEEGDDGHERPHEEAGEVDAAGDVGGPRAARLEFEGDHDEEGEEAEGEEDAGEVERHGGLEDAFGPDAEPAGGVEEVFGVPAGAGDLVAADPPAGKRGAEVGGETGGEEDAEGDDVPLGGPEDVDFGDCSGEEEATWPGEGRPGMEGGPPCVGDIAGSPGVADGLGVVGFEGLPVGIGEDAVVAEREEDGLDVDVVAEGVGTFEVEVPVFGDDFFVPVVDLVEHVPGEGVTAGGEANASRDEEVGGTVDAGEAIGDAKWGGDFPDVVGVEDGGLPEGAVGVAGGEEEVVEGGEVGGVEDCVGIAAGDGVAEEVVAAAFDEATVGLACGPGFVGTFAWGFAGEAGGVEGGEDVAELAGVPSDEAGGFLACAGFAVFHGEDDDELACDGLGCEGFDSASEPFFGFAVVGDDDEVAGPGPAVGGAVASDGGAVGGVPVGAFPACYASEADGAGDGDGVAAEEPIEEEGGAEDGEGKGCVERPPEDEGDEEKGEEEGNGVFEPLKPRGRGGDGEVRGGRGPDGGGGRPGDHTRGGLERGLPTPPGLADGLRPELAAPPSRAGLPAPPGGIRPENWFPRSAVGGRLGVWALLDLGASLGAGSSRSRWACT